MGKELFVVVGEIDIQKIRLMFWESKSFLKKIFKGSLHPILKGIYIFLNICRETLTVCFKLNTKVPRLVPDIHDVFQYIKNITLMKYLKLQYYKSVSKFEIINFPLILKTNVFPRMFHIQLSVKLFNPPTNT